MDKAMDIARQMAHLGAKRELFSQSKERIFGEGPSINESNGAAHLLRQGHHNR